MPSLPDESNNELLRFPDAHGAEAQRWVEVPQTTSLSSQSLRGSTASRSKSSLLSFVTDEQPLESKQATMPKPNSRRRIFYNWGKVFKKLTWITGLQGAFGICIFSLIANLTVLILGATSHGGYKDGISTINIGTAEKIARLSTTYHILINILSTGLLTASNFSMQILCAPTRNEVNRAHAKGTWLDIGILSFHNLKHTSRRRAALCLILAASSLPLHLFYNSAIFEVTAGQNYQITIVNGSDDTELSRVQAMGQEMNNNNWKNLYNTQYVPGYGDLYLISDLVALDFAYNLGNQSWHLSLPTSGDLQSGSWQGVNISASSAISVNATMSLSTSTSGSGNVVSVAMASNMKAIIPLGDYDANMPQLVWPSPEQVDCTEIDSWEHSNLTISDASWINLAPLHIQKAYAVPISDTSSIQIALVYMIVVVICNGLKTIAVFLTLRGELSDQLITQGDAIASFLENNDHTTAGQCTLDRETFMETLKNGREPGPKPWKPQKCRYIDAIKSRGVSIIIMCIGTAISMTGLIYVFITAIKDKDSDEWQWGTASTRSLPFARHSFNSSGLLFNTWLANAPQVLLSFTYFFLNRLCTSACFIREWNSHATKRRGLRATNPRGAQRSTHFLQLPYKFAIPLTIVSCLLHWLLSQALFLVRLDIRDDNGNIREDLSKSTCGYSPESFMVFSFFFMILFWTVFWLLWRRVRMRVPAAMHCSLVISAACHPSDDAVNPGLKRVRWGAVPNRNEGGIGHCSFSNEDVKPPEEGVIYA